MKNFLYPRLGVALVLVTASGLLAQTPAADPSAPPKVLQILREDVKPGKGPAHQKWEEGWPRAYAKAKWPTSYIAMTSVSGPSEAWFMSGYDTFGAWGKDRESFDKNPIKGEDDRLSQGDGEFLSGSRSIVAAYREDLSAWAAGVKLPTMRYFRVVTYRVRPGHDSDFVDAAKTLKAGYEKASVKLPWAVYQIVSGLPTPTYLVFLPMKSFDEIDGAMANSKSIQDALGEETQKKMSKLASDGYLSIESNIYALDSKMSYPSKAWIAGDPEFWTPKPAPAAAKKPAAKP